MEVYFLSHLPYFFNFVYCPLKPKPFHNPALEQLTTEKNDAENINIPYLHQLKEHSILKMEPTIVAVMRCLVPEIKILKRALDKYGCI